MPTSHFTSLVGLVLIGYFFASLAAADERRHLRLLQGGTAGWDLLGTGLALAMINVLGALDVWWTLAGTFGGGMLPSIPGERCRR